MTEFTMTASVEAGMTASATHVYHSSERSKRWLSYSQIASYIRCEWAWFSRYYLRAQKPEALSKLNLGDAIHRAIAARLAGGTIYDGLDQWYAESLETVPEMFWLDAEGNNLLFQMKINAESIALRVLDRLRDEGWRVVLMADGSRAVELELSTSLPGLEEFYDGYAGHLDAILQNSRDNTSWIFDWKTRGTFQNDSSEEVNLQNAGYQKLAMDNGIEVSGTITYQILNKVPAIPKLNKDGSMARSKIATDWDTYKAELIRNRLNPLDYQDMIGKLDTDFIRPIKAYRSPTEVNRMWDEIIYPTACRIAALGRPIRQMAYFSCMNCDSRALCLTSLRGHDYMEQLRNMQYDPEMVRKAEEAGWL